MALSMFFTRKLYQAMADDGRAVLKYFAPYIYRVAIRNKRIVECDESSVNCRVLVEHSVAYLDSG